MKRLILAAMLAACVLVVAVESVALNPQAQGRGRKAVPGGTKTVVLFGPYASQAVAPTGYVIHSGDQEYFWYNTYYMNGTTITMETVPVKVPFATTIVAPEMVTATGQLYHWIYCNAENVAATDSVFFDPMYGGLGK